MHAQGDDPLTACHLVAAVIANAVAFLVRGTELRGILGRYSVFGGSMRTGAQYPSARKSPVQGAA
jgi:hypothetical protein